MRLQLQCHWALLLSSWFAGEYFLAPYTESELLNFFREVKTHLQPRYPNMAYVPDRFVIVVLSAVFAWYFDWPSKGIEVLGDVQASGTLFKVHWPFKKTSMKLASDAFSTSFVIALLGFFESSVAAKSLGTGAKSTTAIKLTLSPNREMVALGTANLIGGLFMAVPAFGGYGRSKVNASTGGKTPMSSIFLSLITIFCIFFVTPYFYYLPVSLSPLLSY
jgi:MFS superfamily sulfate permease-like transporter